MAEYSKDKLYYLKLPKEFFNSYQIKILEGLPNGKDYLLMYLKLMCESISHNGYLRYSKAIPYTPEMIATITSTNLDVVRGGLKALHELDMIEYTSNDSLFIPKVQEMTAITTQGAERKKLQRGGQKGDKCPPNIDIDSYIESNIDEESYQKPNKDIIEDDLTDNDLEMAKKRILEIVRKKKEEFR